MGTYGKINAIWWNIKINLQKMVDIRGFKLPTNLQNFTQKDLTKVKIFRKVLGGYFFETPCTFVDKLSCFCSAWTGWSTASGLQLSSSENSWPSLCLNVSPAVSSRKGCCKEKWFNVVQDIFKCYCYCTTWPSSTSTNKVVMLVDTETAFIAALGQLQS